MSDSWDPMDCSPPGSSVHGIFQARILEWVPLPFSKGSSWPISLTYIYYFHLSLFFSPKYSSLSKVLYIIYLIYFLSSPSKCKFPKDKHFNPLCSLFYPQYWVLYPEYSVNIFLTEWINEWSLKYWVLSVAMKKDIGPLNFFVWGGVTCGTSKYVPQRTKGKKSIFSLGERWCEGVGRGWCKLFDMVEIFKHLRTLLWKGIILLFLFLNDQLVYINGLYR